jgi:hypothetical protein
MPRQLTRDTAKRLALSIALHQLKAANNEPELIDYIVNQGPGVWDLHQAASEVHRELNGIILGLARRQEPLFERS